MSQGEIVALRALLTSRPRPASVAERRERLDALGSAYVTAEDIRPEPAITLFQVIGLVSPAAAQEKADQEARLVGEDLLKAHNKGLVERERGDPTCKIRMETLNVNAGVTGNFYFQPASSVAR